MKKVISLLMAMLMLFSFVPFAVAEETITSSANETETIQTEVTTTVSESGTETTRTEVTTTVSESGTETTRTEVTTSVSESETETTGTEVTTTASGSEETSEENETQPEAHEWGEWVSGEDLHKTRFCKICGVEDTVTIHEFGDSVKTAATCLTPAYYTRTCVCGYAECTIIEDEPALGHNGGRATCIDYAKCERCDVEYGAYGEHVFQNNWERKVVNGKLMHVDTCTACGLATIAGRCVDPENDGDCVCDVCHILVAHNLTHYAAVEETCTQPGRIEYWWCSECHTAFKDENGDNQVDDKNADGKCDADDTVIEAKGHDFTGEAKSMEGSTHSFACKNGCGAYGTVTTNEDDTKIQNENGTVECDLIWKTDKNASCDVGGEKHKECSVCGFKNGETENIPATGHSWDSGIVTAPTCKTQGYTTFTCANCGLTRIEDKTEAVPHKYDELKWKWSSDCESASAVFTCSVGKETKTVKAKVSKKVSKKATTSADGKVTYTASVTFNEKDYKDQKVGQKIYKIKTTDLSKDRFTYNGKVQTPTVVIKNSKGKALKEKTDYTVKYPSGRKYPGTYKVQITFIGKYSGNKTLTFTIGTASVSGIKMTGNRLSWKAVPGASKYVVYVDKKKIDAKKKNYLDLANCEKTYKVRVVAYYGSKTIAKSTTKSVTGKHQWSSSGPECTKCNTKDKFVEYYKIEMKPNSYKVNEKYKSTLYLTVRCKNHNYILSTKTQPNGFTTKTPGTKKITFSAYRNSKNEILYCTYEVTKD